jgi:hypothetical protein
MAIWRLEGDSDFTSFSFPLEEDKTFFHELTENYFEESKEIAKKWRTIYMLRNEPMKHPDFFEIDNTDVIAVSQNAADNLGPLLNRAIELLPIDTDAGRYYALNILNFVDCLNKEESDFVATKDGIIVSYSSLEFNQEKIGNNVIFKIPELPYQIFISDDIQEQCEEEGLQGLLFDTESNLVWYAE